MAKCIAELKVCQGDDERLGYAFNITREFSNLWQPDYPYATTLRVRPFGDETAGTGFEYSSSGGQTAGTEPAWPTTLGDTVTDGSITWTTVAMSYNGLEDRIDTVTWFPAAGITLDGQVDIDQPGLQQVLIYASGGVSGKTYTNYALIETQAGEVYEVRLILTIA